MTEQPGGEVGQFGTLVTYQMKFDEKHVDDVHAGEKTLTARLASEWRHVFDRDGLKILADDGEHVADAIVKRARTLEVSDAFHVVESHSGHGNYGTLDQFREALADYYPDTPILPETEVRLIHFEVIENVE